MKESFLILSEPVSAGPTTACSPVTTLKTPAGRPASSARAASASVVKGVADAGLATSVQPAANAAPALRVSMAAGKFQGVIAATAPTGSRKLSTVSPVEVSITAPVMRSASPANHLMKALA